MMPTLFPTSLASKGLAVLLAALVLAPLAAFPGAARAGTYTTYLCRTPEGGAAIPSELRVNQGPFASILATRDNCPNGPYEMEMDPSKTHPSYDHLSAEVLAPGGTEIQAYKFWRSAQLGPDYRYRYEEISAYGSSELDNCGAAHGCTSKGNPAAPFDPANLVQMANRTGVTGIEWLLTCEFPDESLEKCPATAPGAKFQLYEAELTLADLSAPVLPVAPSGPLVSPTAHLSGTQPVTISATDTGGGVYQAEIEIDGSIVQTSTLDENGGLCHQPFTTVAPCKQSATGSVSFDTAQLADGAHSLKILVTDATGTNIASWGPVTINTYNGACNPSPASDELDMRVKLRGRKHAKAHAITTSYGHPVKIRGWLLDGNGQPVAGADVCVAAQTAAGIGPLRRVGGRLTDQNGYFTFKVKKGPSRRFYFVHRTAAGAAVDSVAVRVRAPLAMKGNPRSLVNGQTMTMRGKLLSPPFPKRGALVELQAYRETGWQTFATTHTNRRGRFSYRYTFSRTTGLQHYLLRARVAKQQNYPFESGSSHPIKVTVSG